MAPWRCHAAFAAFDVVGDVPEVLAAWTRVGEELLAIPPGARPGRFVGQELLAG